MTHEQREPLSQHPHINAYMHLHNAVEGLKGNQPVESHLLFSEVVQLGVVMSSDIPNDGTTDPMVDFFHEAERAVLAEHDFSRAAHRLVLDHPEIGELLDQNTMDLLGPQGPVVNPPSTPYSQ